MLRHGTLTIALNRRSRTALYLQIANGVIEEIRRGRLAPGSPLPSSRDLAKAVGVNRKTVMLAYDELTAQGWLAPERARATFVSPELPSMSPTPFAKRLSSRTGMPKQPDYDLPGTAPNIPLLLAEAGILLFNDGTPDTRLMPAAALARAYRRTVVNLARRNALGYGQPHGAHPLRQAISSMLNLDRGLATRAENICITRGSQMAIFLVARLLVGRGDTVVVEELSYPPAREAFKVAGAEVITIGLDAQGIQLDQLESVCRARRVRAVYLTPHHQFPTTVSLKPDRRLRLLALAEQFGFAIVEDDYDHEFHFSHRPLLPLASADPWGKVVYIGSLSKLLSPHLRTGFIAAPIAFIERAAAEICLIDRQGDSAMEIAVADLLNSGEIRRHARKVIPIYEQRRELFAGLLRQHFGAQIAFDLPEGGLAIWVRFAESIDVDALGIVAPHYGVRFQPGRAFSVGDTTVPAARLGYASLAPQELSRAVERLARAAKRAPG